MTFEEAKQQLAKKHLYNEFGDLMTFMPLVQAINGAAELWQESNLREIERLQKVVDELQIFRADDVKKYNSLCEGIERLKGALHQILHSPSPFNESERNIWINTAREIAAKELLK